MNLASKNPYRYRSYRYDNETGYYYLQSRYYDPSIGRFISADNVGYLGAGENLTSYNLYAYCNNNPVMYTDSKGHWCGIDDAITFLVGGIAGLVGQLITDAIMFAITGEWAGTWESYVGAFVGYGAGAVMTLYSGPIAGFAVAGGLSTLIGQGLEKFTGTKNRSWGEILLNTGFSSGMGALTGALSNGLRISGISAGRNSWSAVFKSGITKIGNGNATRMSRNVFLKGLGATILKDNTVGNIGKGTIKGVKEWVEYFIKGDTKGLGWI